MVKAVCVNGDLDTDEYGSPMPMIGAYIALATLVCFLSMCFDILSGIRRKNQWLPCKLYSLNSFSLSVVAVAAKVPVDLSTPMPRAVDQLSKMTGCLLLCISMGVFMPSLGSMRTAECFSNMAALTVLIVTVIVNIYIQIVTGVIFTFVPEHVILMICMLLVLGVLWSSALTLYLPKMFCNSEYRVVADDHPSEWSLESMQKQLMKLYGLSYCCDPQLFSCETMNCYFLGIPCIVAAAIASEAVIRSYFVKDLRFCHGASDYKWSMWWIFVIQMLCIIIGSFIVIHRWFVMVCHRSLTNFKSLKHSSIARDSDEDEVLPIKIFILNLHFEIPWKGIRLIYCFLGFASESLLYAMHRGVTVAGMSVAFACLKVRNLCSFMFAGKCRDNLERQQMRSEDFENKVITLYRDPSMREWKLRMLDDDTKRWIETNKKDDPINLFSLLSKSLTQQCSTSLLSRIHSELQSKGERVSGGTMVVIAVLNLLISSPQADYIMRCMGESMELIYFIEEKDAKDATDLLRLQWFQQAWAGRDFYPFMAKRHINRKLMATGVPPDEEESVLHHTLRIIQIIRTHKLSFGINGNVICGSIIDADYKSIEELYQSLEVTFLDMMNMLLVDLPRAIFKEYHESYVIEEREERLRKALKFFVKLELLGDKVRWSWPNAQAVAQVSSVTDARAQGEGSGGVEGFEDQV